MKNFNLNVVAAVFVIAIVVTVIMTIAFTDFGSEPTKFVIHTEDEVYFTSDTTMSNGCVIFKSGGNRTTVCGSYSITEVK